ncbi:UDP-4-amino-4,6-dideoxy-N-acetyl-beta-L-altrosamine transaminase [Lachnospiraceae bacterium]|nr:UDP-4-amino-4,6-dideoxy-N-acetyl-beta-L-altrosamine transaminase [Lachnospiraceae bacterium]
MVVDVLRSDYLTTGPAVHDFEQSVAAYVGAKYAVAVSNGTAALHAACYAANIREGDEVITSPLTFAASANCILYCKGTPVFADIKKDTYNIDPEDVKRKITPKTKAIIAVHYAGQPCEMDEIHAIAKDNHLLVIEDAAHALGSKYKGKKIGSLSDMTIFSFHPVKHITTGEGGMITTNNETLYRKLLLFRNHGITRDDSLMTRHEGGWYYQQLELGFNYRISDIQCALGISQMKKLERFVAKRRSLAEKYNAEFENIHDIVCPLQKDDCMSSWHLYVIQVPAPKRRKIYEEMHEAGIRVNVHYIPVYQHPYYQENGFKYVKCPNTEFLYERILSLPLYYQLEDNMQDFVIKTLKKILR